MQIVHSAQYQKTNSIEKQAKDLTRPLSSDGIQMAIEHMKDAQHQLEKRPSKLQRGIKEHPSEWPSSKRSTKIK